jgi:RNA polymerase sigma factor (sigma-70 family)
MQNVRDGNIGELAILFERHHAALYNYYVRLTRQRDLSEDLVQEVFLRILKFRHTFRGEGAFTTWMYSIARNVRIDYARKWGRERPMTDEDHERAHEDLPSGDTAADGENVALLQQALSLLTPDKREVLILSRYQDLKYATIAEILGCSAEAVKARVHRAMNDLREKFFELSGKEIT